MDEFKKLLTQFVTFKSISTDPTFKPEIVKTVNWLKQLFIKYGFMVEVFTGSSCHPVVLATLTTHNSLPTVLIYGHYDVQPADPAGWLSDPFVLTSRDDRLWGRGVLDNKGQILIHIFTVLELIKKRKLAYNVKFLIEGNEETSNPDLPSIMRKHKSELKSDYVLVSDGETVNNFPVIESSLRGGFNLTLKYTTAANNLHSGIYGGAAPNAAHELTHFISRLFDSKNKIAIPGFYQNVDQITSFQIKNNQRVLRISPVQAPVSETGLDFYTQTGLRPTLQVTGLKAGYINDGYANIVPASAEARINFRIVTSQNPQEVFKTFTQFVKNHTPSYVSYDITHSGEHSPVKLNTSQPIFKHIRKLLVQVYSHDPILKYVGGAIPFISDVKSMFGIDTISVPLGNEDCNMHGANENFRIDLIEKGLRFSQLFFSGH